MSVIEAASAQHFRIRRVMVRACFERPRRAGALARDLYVSRGGAASRNASGADGAKYVGRERVDGERAATDAIRGACSCDAGAGVTGGCAEESHDRLFHHRSGCLLPALRAYAAQAGLFKDDGLDVTVQTAAQLQPGLQLLLDRAGRSSACSIRTRCISPPRRTSCRCKMTYVMIRKTIYTAARPGRVADQELRRPQGQDRWVFHRAPQRYNLCQQSLVENGTSARRHEGGRDRLRRDLDGSAEERPIDAFIAWPGCSRHSRTPATNSSVLPEAAWQNQYYGIGLVATTDYIKSNPDVIEKIAMGLAKTAVVLKTGSGQGRRVVLEDLSGAGADARRGPAVALKKQRNILDATDLADAHRRTAGRFCLGLAGHRDLGASPQAAEGHEAGEQGTGAGRLLLTDEFTAAANNVRS